MDVTLKTESQAFNHPINAYGTKSKFLCFFLISSRQEYWSGSPFPSPLVNPGGCDQTEYIKPQRLAGPPFAQVLQEVIKYFSACWYRHHLNR